jgi:hypothetical protein
VTPDAEANTRKALQLDDTIAQAHRTLGVILHSFYWQWDEGDKENRRAGAQRQLCRWATSRTSPETSL